MNDETWAQRYAFARRLNEALLKLTPAIADLDGEPFTSTLFDDLPARREPFQDALYRVAQAAGPTSRDIDALLDAHRQAFGEPEQAAYARLGDECDPRLPAGEAPSVETGEVGEYLVEHHSWKR